VKREDLVLERQRLELLTGQIRDIEEREHSADQEVRRLNAVALELNRLVAELRWEAAAGERKRFEKERAGARELLDAWHASDRLLRYGTAQAEAEQIRVIVRQQETEAEPVFRAREIAANRLARGLIATADHAADDAERADQEAEDLRGPIEQACIEERAAIGAAEAAKARADTAQSNIDGAQAAVRAAVAEGLLPRGADVAETAEEARHVAEQADVQVTDAMARIDDLAAERESAGEALADLVADREKKSREAENAAERLLMARQFAEELSEEHRLAEILGSTEVILDSDTPELLSRLQAGIRVAEDKQTKLGIDAAADQRTLEALGTGGLLPPVEEITVALRLLESHGITGWSGWQYLAQIRADERDHILVIYPHLVDGIVLNSGDDLGDARQILTEARLLPRTVIAVGTTAAMADAKAQAPAGICFIVPPNPAMFDESTAEQERQETEHRQVARTARLTELRTAAAADRTLHSRLTDWQRDYPPPTLERLEHEHQQADGELGLARRRRQEQRDLVTALTSAEKDFRRQLPQLQQHAKSSEKRATTLTALAAEHVRIPQWQEIISAARDEARRASQEADEAREKAEELRRQQSEAFRRGDDQRRIAAACRDELRDVTGGGSTDNSIPAPDEPLSTLRVAYQAAAATYEKVQVNADLYAELTRAENAESEARSAVENLRQQVQAHARDLLSGPDGADAAARMAATARTERLVRRLDEQVTRAAEKAAALRSDYDRYQPQERSLEPYGRPRDIPQGEELIAQATRDRDEARGKLEEVQGSKEVLEHQAKATKETADTFSAVMESLGAIVAPDSNPEASPFPGTTDDARVARDAVRETLAEAVRLLEDATQQVRWAADKLAQYAADGRFEKVAGPVRRHVIATDRERLPDFAADWEAALRPRLRVLTDELNQIERHRAAIITRLHGMVAQALGKLRAAQRASKLPDELGDWSGQEFLRISFAVPEDAALAERLGQVIDEAVARRGENDKYSGKRDGLSLLLRGVRVAMQPKGVRVEMLKPDAVLRTERVQVSEISDVFSGGQLLTAAIILYCTMASLRANERGYVQRTHAGVLFLDNPIGRASAGYLLELQMAVAEKLGVQLVYTTGLFDTNALSVFPLIIRLRNDADLRAGMKYLSVDDEIRKMLPAGPADDTGTLTASRVFARPRSRIP